MRVLEFRSMRIYMYIWVYICMNVYIWVYIYEFIYIYVHIYAYNPRNVYTDNTYFFSFSYILMSYSEYSMPTELKQEIYFGIICDERKLGLLFERLPEGASDLATQSKLWCS